MELIASPKFEYLLLASLEVLHEQSIEWLSEIALFKEEISFFNKLLNKNAGHQFPTEQATNLDLELNSFNSDTLITIHNEIMDHERELSDILKPGTLGRQDLYRGVHRELMERMKTCKEEFLQIKTKIFSFARN